MSLHLSVDSVYAYVCVLCVDKAAPLGLDERVSEWLRNVMEERLHGRLLGHTPCLCSVIEYISTVSAMHSHNIGSQSEGYVE